MDIKEIREEIIRGNIDINSQENFFSELIKSTILELNSNIKLYNENINHFFLNTGDDLLWKKTLGYDFSVEPLETSNNDYVYNKIPRSILNFDGITINTDQFTQPFIRGECEIGIDNKIIEFSAEIKRIPVEISLSAKYYVSTFTDVLTLSQELLSKMAFNKKFIFEYLGKTVDASIQLPTTINHEKNITPSFDDENNNKTIEIEYIITSNLPIFNNRTAVETNAIITETKFNEIV